MCRVPHVSGAPCVGCPMCRVPHVSGAPFPAEVAGSGDFRSCLIATQTHASAVNALTRREPRSGERMQPRLIEESQDKRPQILSSPLTITNLRNSLNQLQYIFRKIAG